MVLLWILWSLRKFIAVAAAAIAALVLLAALTAKPPALPPDAVPAAQRPADAFEGLLALSQSKAAVGPYADIAGRSLRALKLTVKDSPVSLPLDGRYHTFSFSLVEAAGQSGRTWLAETRFAAAGDGRLLYSRKIAPEAPLSAPETVTVDVSGVQKLELALSSDARPPERALAVLLAKPKLE